MPSPSPCSDFVSNSTRLTGDGDALQVGLCSVYRAKNAGVVRRLVDSARDLSSLAEIVLWSLGSLDNIRNCLAEWTTGAGEGLKFDLYNDLAMERRNLEYIVLCNDDVYCLPTVWRGSSKPCSATSWISRSLLVLPPVMTTTRSYMPSTTAKLGLRPSWGLDRCSSSDQRCRAISYPFLPTTEWGGD